jgi:hypothetical protein
MTRQSIHNREEIQQSSSHNLFFSSKNAQANTQIYIMPCTLLFSLENWNIICPVNFATKFPSGKSQRLGKLLIALMIHNLLCLCHHELLKSGNEWRHGFPKSCANPNENCGGKCWSPSRGIQSIACCGQEIDLLLLRHQARILWLAIIVFQSANTLIGQRLRPGHAFYPDFTRCNAHPAQNSKNNRDNTEQEDFCMISLYFFIFSQNNTYTLR